ncbi:protein of unknown function [Xenorhabdus poinarii G6]|uniref:Uncharacterized protein n=1 Tax=Xenorhabdus poinarii G6 TaxID=1354304 RepID=A0A068R006_9GAMM|nr:hypothetical protein [Xenorhabdus poinarii]CDG20533.1 protein of unknown function [Xenorhabdus poinarii G6]
MLSKDDLAFLNGRISEFKSSFFQFVSDFGPDCETRFVIGFDEIGNSTGRERFTTPMLTEYQNYLEMYGFYVVRENYFFQLTLTVRGIVTMGNEAIKLANALELFRTRALYHRDLDNM